EDLTAAGDMRELAAMVERVPKGAALVRATDDHDGHEESEEGVTLPESITWLGQRVLDAGRRLAYHGLLETEITGRSHVPYHTNFIVAPNHCSHADIGLVKEALGDAGKNLCALAATDYFFDSKAKRTFFENFTKVVPMDRAGSLRKSLRRAHDLLLQGYSLLIFPEGTRSPDGQLRDFKASIGYLALQARTPILPMYLEGTHDVLPKGARMIKIKSREVGAHIGQLLTLDEMQQLSEGLGRAEAYRAVAFATQRMVEALRDGEIRPALSALREQWSAHHGGNGNGASSARGSRDSEEDEASAHGASEPDTPPSAKL
ncbi:MAG: 1-acyl-sn-glycerol-3-phosphate acyltransferase, partial [Myxococcales bacterium]|nr:1-acyl-sn-glycerol-3-phosphate acyltransferase [Myxococcales bacterium]